MIPVGNEEDEANEEHSLTNDNHTANMGKIEYAISKRWEAQQESGQSDKCTPQTCISDIFCCCAKQLGSMHVLCERRDGSPVVIAGPMWPFCMFVTVPLVAVLSTLVLYFFMLQENAPLPWWAACIYAPVMGITILSLFMVSCRDPGLVERKITQDSSTNAFLWNEQVGSYRQPDALYCRECQVLVEEMDHVCPWTGTAIGRKNMLAFKWFVIFVNLLCYGSIGITAYALLGPGLS